MQDDKAGLKSTISRMADHATDRVAAWLDGSLPSDDLPPPEIWACVEIFGHRKHYGRAREVERFGVKLLRVDVPAMAALSPLEREQEKFETFLYGGAAIFSFTPMTEEAARQWADRERGGRPIRPLDRLPAPEPEYDDDMPF